MVSPLSVGWPVSLPVTPPGAGSAVTQVIAPLGVGGDEVEALVAE